MRQNNAHPRRRGGFALFEVMIGLTIFVVGILILGRSVENCLNASVLSEQEDRIRQVLADRMAEVQTAPGVPEQEEIKVKTGYGEVRVAQKVAPADLVNEKEAALTGIYRVGLTALWNRGRVPQERSLEFYVFRP